LAGLVVLAGAASAAELRLEGKFEDATLRRDVRVVLRDVRDVYEMNVSKAPPGGHKPIVVCQAPDGAPRACLNRLPQTYQINITNLHTRLYSQQVYQFAHELGHVWIDPRRGGWFIESMATALSLVCLTEVGQKWKTDPPFPNWKDYAKHFHAYRATTITGHLKELGLDSEGGLDKWARKDLPTLVRERKAGRSAQHGAAVLIERALRGHPKRWSALTKLGKATTEEGRTDLAKWQALVTPEERPLVEDLARTFGRAAAAQPRKERAEREP
jgi:hypothetical protein